MSITLTVTGTYKNNKTTSIGVHQPKNYDFIESSRMTEFKSSLNEFMQNYKKFKKVTISIDGTKTVLEGCPDFIFEETFDELLTLQLKFSSFEVDHFHKAISDIRNGVDIPRLYFDNSYLIAMQKNLHFSDVAFEVIELTESPVLDRYTFSVLRNCSNELKIVKLRG